MHGQTLDIVGPYKINLAILRHPLSFQLCVDLKNIIFILIVI